MACEVSTGDSITPIPLEKSMATWGVDCDYCQFLHDLDVKEGDVMISTALLLKCLLAAISQPSILIDNLLSQRAYTIADIADCTGGQVLRNLPIEEPPGRCSSGVAVLKKGNMNIIVSFDITPRKYSRDVVFSGKEQISNLSVRLEPAPKPQATR